MDGHEAERGRRRLGAILFADVAGYSILMAEDEMATHDAIKGHLRTFEQYSRRYEGEILQVRGDGIFALFDSVVNAVRFGIEVQKAVAAADEHAPEERRIRFRIGINLGEVLRDEADVYGDSVNVAARIEALADPAAWRSPLPFTSRSRTHCATVTNTLDHSD